MKGATIQAEVLKVVGEN